MNDNEYDVKYDKTLYDLVADYWADYLKNKDREVVVKQKDDDNRVLTYSMPIVWFGNLNAYMASDLKVVTVGLNPSDNEFRDDKKAKQGQKGPFTFMRFSDDVKKLAGKELPEAEEDKKEAIKNLIRSYNKYFDNDPYKDWFDKGFGSSFGCFSELGYKLVSYYATTEEVQNKKANAVIHIDFKTAIATEPTWSKLKGEEYKTDRDELSKEGVKLFWRLWKILNPDIMLFSQSDNDLRELSNNAPIIGQPQSIKKRDDGSDYKKKLERRIYNINGTLLLYETFSGTYPFGLKDERREDRIAELIKEHQIWKKE